MNRAWAKRGGGILLCCAAALLCALLIGLPSGAARAAAPSYANDFSSGTLDGFTATGDIGNFTVKNGVLTCESVIDDALWFGEDDWTEYTAEFDFTTLGGEFNGAFLIKAGDREWQVSLRSLAWPYSTTGNLVEIYYDGKTAADSADYVNGKKAAFADGAPMHVKVVVRQAAIRVFVDGRLYLDFALREGDRAPLGKAGIKIENSLGEFDNLLIREITDADLAEEEITVGGANGMYTITTRPGQTPDYNRRMDPTFRTVSIAAVCVAGAALVGFWAVFAIQTVRGKKK